MKTFKEILKESGILNKISAESEKAKKKFGIKNSDIQNARKELSKLHKVPEENLVFWAVGDYGSYEIKGKMIDNVLISFNIADSSHKNNKSTVNYTWLPKEKRGVNK